MKGIYKITNTKNNRAYIGRSKDIFSRINSHFYLLQSGKHTVKKFQEDFKDQNINDFSVEIIDICKVMELPDKEEHYIRHFDTVKTGYNTIYKDGDVIGSKFYDSSISQYAKNAFYKKADTQRVDIKILDDSEVNHIIEIFEELEICRPKEQMFVIPNKYEKYRSVPFIFCYKDFNIED
jgi:group I intron endonuclease